MPYKYASGNRPITPPPICKAPITPPILSPRPQGALIVNFLGTAIDWWHTRLYVAERHFLYQQNDHNWLSRLRPGLQGCTYIQFDLDEWQAQWQLAYDIGVDPTEPQIYESGFIPLGDASPFRAGPMPGLPQAYTGDLTVTIAQYI
jgi:hypothetical protein